MSSKTGSGVRPRGVLRGDALDLGCALVDVTDAQAAE
jgi:hypothetical protein